MTWGVARVDQLITAAFLVSGFALVLFVLLVRRGPSRGRGRTG